jgi:hypothetical protein
MTLDARLFYSIVSPPPDGEAGARERRRSFRRPVGTIATITRVIDGVEHHRLSVLVMDRSDHSVGIRSPIGLTPGAFYRLQIGCDHGQSILIQISSSRRRDDDSYDVGAEEIANVAQRSAVAA